MAFMAKADPKDLSRHIDRRFLLNLVALFQSEDPRERDCLRYAYHELYVRLPAERPFMRKLMSDVYLQFVIDGGRHSGIGDLLEISGRIIDELDVPVEEEHRQFLEKVLMPLHKPSCMGAYHKELTFCVVQLIRKEGKLLNVVVKGVLRHWPVTNCRKQVLLLDEMMVLVDNMNTAAFAELALPICSRIAKCTTSANTQVAKKALSVWNKKQFMKRAIHCWEIVLPVTVEAMENNLKCHWSNSIRKLTARTKTMLEAVNPALYAKHQQQLGQRKTTAAEQQAMRKLTWEKLEMASSSSHLFPPLVNAQ